jgi:hypothetical protein
MQALTWDEADVHNATRQGGLHSNEASTPTKHLRRQWAAGAAAAATVTDICSPTLQNLT